MIPLVKICKEDNCTITITDVTQDSDNYLDENITDTLVYHQNNKFKYSETATVNIVCKHTTTDTTIVNTYITTHETYLDEEHVYLEQDGYYTIYHVILPTKDAVTDVLDTHDTSYKGYVVEDCDNIALYTTAFNPAVGIYGQWLYLKIPISPQELVELIDAGDFENTTISSVVLTQFSICNLYNCFLKKCNTLFKSMSPCQPKSSEAQYQRDLVWMVINVIKYYVEIGQLLEAQSLLESLNYCGELCSDEVVSQTSDCGCNK